MKTVVIGSGILGAALAARLAGDGAEVVVIDGGPGATACSFGWINASFHLDAAHFRLRAEGIAAWHRLGAVPGLEWCGALSWEHPPEALEVQAAGLEALGYPLRRLDGAALAARLPALGPRPTLALEFPGEGAVDPAAAAAALLDRAAARGARILRGGRVQAVTTRAGRVAGVRTDWGEIPADAVAVAAGTGAPALLEPLGLRLPLLRRPGAMMVSRPLPRVTDTILAAPGREIRQDATGRLLAPGVPAHQTDDSETLGAAPEARAAEACAAVAALFPGLAPDWTRLAIADRPMPQDGRPALGAAGPDAPEELFVSVMHSGVTLAAVAAEALADRIRGGDRHAALVAPYDPARFAS